jgi:hypothetical protein
MSKIVACGTTDTATDIVLVSVMSAISVQFLRKGDHVDIVE